MPGKFLKILRAQVVALAISTPAAGQSEVPAGLFRKGPSFQQRVERRLDEHEERLTRLELVSSPRRSSVSGGGKNPVASSSVRPAAKQPVTASKGSTAARTGSHTVRTGETPSSIARKYGVSVAQLQKANGLGAGSVIRPGQKLVLPGSGKSKPPASAAAVAVPPSKAPSKSPAPPPKVASGIGRHTVKKGETVRGLASRFGLSEKEFMRLNNLKDPTKLRAGAVVTYPLGGEADTAEAFAGTPAGPPVERLPSGWRWHTVERGESLSQIAARHGLDRGSLERANALSSGAPIHEGLRLKVPPAGQTLDLPEADAPKRPPGGEDHSVLAYTVQQGDTLEKLSETFATTPAILRQLNRLGPGDTLASGNRIVVPNNLFE
jgi:LysM repeat protein